LRHSVYIYIYQFSANNKHYNKVAVYEFFSYTHISVTLGILSAKNYENDTWILCSCC